jgi:hypothetical protein
VLQWILPCFVGYRGSGVWTFNTTNTANTDHVYTNISVTREPVLNMTWSDGLTTYPNATTSSGTPARFLSVKTATDGGTALTNQYTQAGLSVLCPNYNLYKFNSTAPGNTTSAPITTRTQDGSADDTFVLQITDGGTAISNCKVDKYWHAGPDFQPLFFLNVPSYYALFSIPAPN